MVTLVELDGGRVRLFHGDAYAIRPTLGWFDGEVMDPPYRFNNSGGGAFRKARTASNTIVDTKLDKGFDHRIINPALCGSVMVFCHPDELFGEIPQYLKANFSRLCALSWHKPNPSPMRNKHYLADTEYWLHAWNKGYNPQGCHHDMHRHITARSLPSKTYGHPTVKPDAVMDKCIANLMGASVIDPFMGTGSTGVAAVKQGRSFVGIEQDEAYFEVAVARLMEATGDRF